MIARHLPSAEQPHKEIYAILLRGSEDDSGKPKMVGSCGIPRIPADGMSIEVGYGIIPEYWGNGYAPEAVKLFCHYYWNIRGRYPPSDHERLFQLGGRYVLQ